MLFSKATTHALRALAALEGGTGPRGAQVLAAELGLPGPYLVKVFQTLAQGGLLTAVRGAHGGFCLARPAEEVTVLDVVRLVESQEPLGQCILGLADCGRTSPCPLHGAWSRARSGLEQELGGITLATLQAAFQSPERGA
nr:Rrf2 family transcriptional regulator [uncultured Holophaga sp.]